MELGNFDGCRFGRQDTISADFCYYFAFGILSYAINYSNTVKLNILWDNHIRNAYLINQ